MAAQDQLLSEEDLYEVTRARQVAGQKRVLDRNGIYYIERRDGTITTTWHHINHPIRLKKPDDGTRDEPNWDALEL